MTKHHITFPYEWPLNVSPGCGITAKSGELIGYTRWDNAKQIQSAQVAARYFGASPLLANELFALGLAARRFLNAVLRDEEHAELAVNLEKHLTSARLAFDGLIDKRYRLDASVNAPITEALELFPDKNGGRDDQTKH